MKHQLILSGLFLMVSGSIAAQSYFDDDIYYNPKKSENKTETPKKTKKQSNYIANLADMDVDEYNRRNQYYLTPVDTIGSGVENAEDFVYTQQIQKFYNPTIVVDNANILEDVLANAYGNVEIVINDNGLPVFTPYYSYGWPYYNRWGWNVGSWGWNVSFYDPWYSWNWNWGWGSAWGPAWNWGPSWAWGPAWGPSWGWGPAWGPSWGWGPNPPMANWRPNGNRPVAPNPGWTGNHRPGVGGGSLAHRVPNGSGNMAGNRPGHSNIGGSATNNHRPGVGTNYGSNSNSRPANGVSSARPGSNGGVVNNNGKWEYVNGGHRVPAGSVNSGNNHNGNSRPGGNYSTGSQNSNRGNSTVNNNRNQNTNSNRNYNTNSNTNSNRSFNTGRSTSTNRGGSFGGGRSSGGGARSGGGRHR